MQSIRPIHIISAQGNFHKAPKVLEVVNIIVLMKVLVNGEGQLPLLGYCLESKAAISGELPPALPTSYTYYAPFVSFPDINQQISYSCSTVKKYTEETEYTLRNRRFLSLIKERGLIKRVKKFTRVALSAGWPSTQWKNHYESQM